MTKEALKLALDFIENSEGGTADLEAHIKEALAQPEQEPVGEIVDAIEGAFKCSFTKMLPVGTKLYTTSPQRTWVGLTGKDWNRSKHNYDFQKGVDWAESILKERNG